MVTIRQATARDFAEMMKLRIEFYEDHLAYDPLLNPSSNPKVKRELKKEIQSSLYGANRKKIALLAIDDDKPVGYLTAEIKLQEDIFKQKKEGHISNIYVRPNALRKHIGLALVQEAHTWFRSKGAKVVKLVVYLDNESGKLFWPKMGYAAYQQHMYTLLDN